MTGLDCVYFIRNISDGNIKIGYSTRVIERYYTLRSTVKCPMEILAVIQGDRCDEALLHRRFSKDKIKGEWFHPSEELMKYIHECKNTKAITIDKLPKMMRLDDRVHKRLTDFCKKGETYSEAINRLLDEHEAAKPTQ